MPTVQEVIVHCQSKIKKDPPTDKLLHYLKRLGRLRITINDLRETGVGKTVNQLSRLDGEVGRYAGQIVEEWKAMVETETDGNQQSESGSGSDSDLENELEIDMNHRTESSPSEERDFEDHHLDRNNDSGIVPQPTDDEETDNETSNNSRLNTLMNIKQEMEDEDDEDDDDNDNEDEEDGNDEDLKHNGNNIVESEDEHNNFDHISNNNNNNSAPTFLKVAENECPDSINIRNKNRDKDKISLDIRQHHISQNRSPTTTAHHSDERRNHRSSSSHSITDSTNREKESKKEKYYNRQEAEDKSSSKKLIREDKIKKEIIDDDAEHTVKERDRGHGEKQSSKNKQSIEQQQHNKHLKESKDHRSNHHHEKGRGDKERSSKDRHHRHTHREDEDNAKNSNRSNKDDDRSSNGSSSKRDRRRDKEHHHHRKDEKTERDEDKHNSNEKNRSTSSKHEKHDRHHHEKHKSTDKEKSSGKHDTTNNNNNNIFDPPILKIKEEKRERSKESLNDEKSSHSQHNHNKRKKPDIAPEEIKKEEKSKKKLKVISKLESQEIDSTSGLNFADVLGCLDSKATGSKSSKKLNTTPSGGGGGGSSSSSKSSSKKIGESSIIPPPPLSFNKSVVKTEPVNDFQAKSNGNSYESYAPPVLTIQPPKPAFQPLDLFPEEKPCRTRWEDDLLSIQETPSDFDTLSSMITSRKDRTKVYSGHKSGFVGEIPSLFNMCIRVIQENLDSLGYTGGVPYDILKPALERATVKQLSQIEFYNPYLLESTDELWKFHCHRDCRGQKPQEMECWRELYYRFQEERRMRLKMLSSKVKKSVELAQPVRKAKLAYVEPSSRGPKFSKSKAATIKNGMKTLKHREEKGVKVGGPSYSASSGGKNSGSTSTTSYEEAAITISADSRAGSAPAPSIPRDNPTSSAFKKPRKAPLMQKALKTMKTVFRR